MGPYRIQARLGAGGMGQVYLAFSPGGRAVAVKVIHPELARDQAFLARFRQEVATARKVSGAFTAAVVDASGAGEVPPWLVTVFVPGPSLADVVTDRGPLAEESLWRLAAGLVEALTAVHRQGLVHRDLKPANVLLAADGPRVIDFGIARALDAAGATTTGMIVGTPSFMSPEQAEGLPAGPASDVFSLGCALACAATGTAPFGGGIPASVIYRIVHTQPDLGSVPDGLRSLITKCLAKDPAARSSLAELMQVIGGRPAPADAGLSFWPPGLAEVIASYQAQLPSAKADGSWPEPGIPASPAPHEPTQAASTVQQPDAPGVTVTSPGPRPAEAPAAAGRRPARRARRVTILAAAASIVVIGGVVAISLAAGAKTPRPAAGGPGAAPSRPPHTGTATPAAAPSMGVRSARSAVSVAACPTQYGVVGSTAPPVPTSLEVTGSMAGRLVGYSNGWLSMLAPPGWVCRGGIGADGGRSLTAYPAGQKTSQFWVAGTPSDNQAISLGFPSPETGPAFSLACSFFPSAHKQVGPGGGQCPTPPAGELVHHAGPGIVEFEDPPGVAGDALPSGGPYPANGVIVWDQAAGYAAEAVCTLPAQQHHICTAVLNDFLQRYSSPS